MPDLKLLKGLSQQRLHIQDIDFIPNWILLDLVYTFLGATAPFLCSGPAEYLAPPKKQYPSHT